MVSNSRHTLPPMRVPRTGNRSQQASDLPQLSERVPIRELAPNRRNPTEGNGTSTPREQLHIILLARNHNTANLLKNHVRVIKPPLWRGGEVLTHIVESENLSSDDILIRQAMVDLGWADSKDLDISGYPPSETTE